MNTSFKILWFEDSQDWYEMEQIKIVEILKEHYLKPEIIHKKGNDFNINELKGNDYDLILMDFKLTNGETGDNFISVIRNSNILTDILFYSSDFDNILNSIKNDRLPIDGIYISQRNNDAFNTKLERLVNKIIRRSEDIVNLRGLVLDNTSDFEYRIKTIIDKSWKMLDENQKKQLTMQLIGIFTNRQKGIEKILEKAKNEQSYFEETNQDDHKLTIGDRLLFLDYIIPILTEDYCLKLEIPNQEFKKYYIDKINVYRNKLGHTAAGNNTIKIQGNDIEVDEELYKVLRKNIAEVDSMIHKIEEFFMANNCNYCSNDD